MPTYEYVCETNGREIAVFHPMSTRLKTWGELCDLAAVDPGTTDHDAPVQRRIGAGITMARNPGELSGYGGSCCGEAGCGD
ncbi:MAG: zinc ribbon domain-containing protein [Planctomycetota bacterium]